MGEILELGEVGSGDRQFGKLHRAAAIIPIQEDNAEMGELRRWRRKLSRVVVLIPIQEDYVEMASLYRSLYKRVM